MRLKLSSSHCRSGLRIFLCFVSPSDGIRGCLREGELEARSETVNDVLEKAKSEDPLIHHKTLYSNTRFPFGRLPTLSAWVPYLLDPVRLPSYGGGPLKVLPGTHAKGTETELRRKVKDRIGHTIVPRTVEIGDLSRSEKKTPRVFDNRY